MKYGKGEYRSGIDDDTSFDQQEASDALCLGAIRGHDWFQAFAYAPDDVEREDVVEVIYCVDGENDADSWVLVAKLKDGRYLYLSAGCDYTGWDCRAGGSGETRDTLEAIMVECVTEGDVRRFGITKASK